MEKNELINKIIGNKPSMHYAFIDNNYVVFNGLENNRERFTLNSFRGKTFYDSNDVYKMLNELYTSVLEDNNEVYVIYELDYDIVRIKEVIYSQDIGTYITNFILKCENPSWFFSYKMHNGYIRIQFINPENNAESFATIDFEKIKINTKL